MNYMQVYVQYSVTLPNTAILNIRILSRRYHFRLWVFASTGEYYHYKTDEYYPMRYKLNDTQDLQKPFIYLYGFKLAHKSSYIADWLNLIGAFKITLLCVLLDLIRRISNYMCQILFIFKGRQQAFEIIKQSAVYSQDQGSPKKNIC